MLFFFNSRVINLSLYTGKYYNFTFSPQTKTKPKRKLADFSLTFR